MADFGLNEMLTMQRELQDKYKEKWEQLILSISHGGLQCSHGISFWKCAGKEPIQAMLGICRHSFD